MALETGSFVDDLVTTNPVGATDDVNKGDDHLRLIKSVLKATFPNATKAFRFETVLTKATTYPIVAADARALVLADASSGVFTITLPLGSTVFAGYSVIVMKSDSSGNAVTVDGNGAETINGSATRSLSAQFQSEKYVWDGSEWKVLALTRVGTDEIEDGAVTTAKIAAGAVDTAELAADAVTTVKILDANVTLAKIADIATDRLLGREASGSGVVEQLTLGSGLDLDSGAIRVTPNGIDGTHIALGSDTQGDVMYYDGTDWVRLAKSTDGKFLKLASGIPAWGNGAGSPETFKSFTAAATSTFSSIIAGATRITGNVGSATFGAGTDRFEIRLGDSGGIDATGYVGRTSQGGNNAPSHDTGFVLHDDTANARVWDGTFVLNRREDHIWHFFAIFNSGSGNVAVSMGRHTLTGALTDVQVTTFGGATMTASGGWSITVE